MNDIHFDHLLYLARAGAHVLHVASFEWRRVRGLAVGLAHELGLPEVQVWNSAAGLCRSDENGNLTPSEEQCLEPIAALEQLLTLERGALLLLEDIHPYLRPEHHQAIRWVRRLAQATGEPRHLVVLSTPLPTLPIELSKEVPTLELPLPDVETLRVICDEVAAAHGVPFDGDEALLNAARGLTIMEAKLAFGQAALALRRLDRRAVPQVVREKERVIRQSQVLEYYEPHAGLADVGGLEHLKTWLERRGKAFGSGAREYGLEPPKGVLLLGVQGCGKSLVAKAIAATWQFPLLRFDLGKVFGGIVGQSEENIRTALQVAQALAPCVLWIDEIEKGLAGMGSSDRTDGGTTARVVGTLLTWMQEKRDPVFVVATANRIDMLPPELLRKGRFDEIFFVDLPMRRVREDILAIHLRKKERSPGEFDLARLSEISVGYSGAELEEAVREGLFEAFAAGAEVRTEHIERALKATYPLSRTMRDALTELRSWARVRARLASNDEPEALPKDEEGKAPIPQLRQEARNPFIPRRSPDAAPDTAP